MRSFNPAFAATLGCLLFVGCASTAPSPDNAAPKAELVYRTGSHIPIRDVQPMTKEEREKQADESRAILERIQRSGPGVTKN